ncbi:MAG TPA: ABC transporter permease [Candidatus Methylomirabilis sp.]|nr:ABC transporter permease [Candidatus Methylomirabilis sp.]
MKFPLWRRSKEELEEELQSHLHMAASDRMDRGAGQERARSEARREFGNVGLVSELTQEMWGWGTFERLWQDMRYGMRMLLKAPGFAAVAILTLALGIGANTALFSVVNGVLFQPLPYPHPEQLVWIAESKPNFASGSISWPNFRDWQKDNHTFTAMAIYRGAGFHLTGRGEAERVNARFLSSEFFDVLGVHPLMGRAFLRGEDEIGAAPVAMITEELWRRKFGASPEALGKSVNLDGKAYTIVGVLPAGFDLSGMFRGVDVYVPIGQWDNPLLPTRGAGLGIHGIGRLKTGVTIEQARADMARVSSNLAAAYPDTNTNIGTFLRPLKQTMVGKSVSTLLLVLLAAVGFVLLIACVNVANLMLARASARTREFAVRAAIGASRGRLVRQLLTESLLLAMIGGGVGLLLAGWGTQAALRKLAEGLPRAGEVHLDARALLFTVAISLGSGIFFGLVPALKTGARSLHDTLKEGGRGGSGSRHRAQGILVAVEMAVALVLLISAGLMVRSLSELWHVNPGFDSHNVLTFGVALPPSMRTAGADGIRAALRNVEQRMKAVPGVDAVSLSWAAVPLSSDDEDLFWIEGKPKPQTDNDMSWSLSYVVQEDYLKVMGIPLERGRFFTAQDNETGPHVVVVDDVFAQKYFPEQDPIGRHIFLQNKGGRAEIIGVVPHVKQWGLDSDDRESLRAELYFPYMQLPDAAMQLSWSGTGVMLRYDARDRAVASSLRAAIRSVSDQNVMSRTQTMDSIIADSLAAQRFSRNILAIFAAFALLLACVGIYGVVSYVVGRRTQEIGIRMALGAKRGDVLRMVLGDGMKMTLAGVLVGIAAAFGLTRLMADLLFGVSATDPITFVCVAILLTIVALAACYLPARRAVSVDPIAALRYE